MARTSSGVVDARPRPRPAARRRASRNRSSRRPCRSAATTVMRKVAAPVAVPAVRHAAVVGHGHRHHRAAVQVRAPGVKRQRAGAGDRRLDCEECRVGRDDRDARRLPGLVRRAGAEVREEARDSWRCPSPPGPTGVGAEREGRWIVDGGDGQVDRRDARLEGAIAGAVGEAVRAVGIRGRRVGERARCLQAERAVARGRSRGSRSGRRSRCPCHRRAPPSQPPRRAATSSFGA